jgi:hypothetical protein
MRLQITLNHAQAKAKLMRWAGEIQNGVRQATATVLKKEAVPIKAALQAHVSQRLNIVRRPFARSFFTRVLESKKNRLPALHIGARVPWLGIHETGGVITGKGGGKLLIPLHGRVGRKTFKAQIAALRRGGNAFFIKSKNGTVILMAENQKEYDRPLSGYKRRYRQASGLGRMKRGAEVPIAVLVPKVTIKKRLDLANLIAARIPELITALEQQLLALNRR